MGKTFNGESDSCDITDSRVLVAVNHAHTAYPKISH